MMERVLESKPVASQAYELIVPALVDSGMETMFAPKVNFLTLALVQPTEESMAPITVQQQVGMASYIPGPAVFSHHREHILYLDLPGLLPSTMTTDSDPALLDVARGVRDMVAESRADRDHRKKLRGGSSAPSHRVRAARRCDR
jgi:hypothetical protein